MTKLYRIGFALVVSVAAAVTAPCQLTITPGRTAATAAGTGSAGYSGDGGPAASAMVASPSAVTYDTSGNLYFADTRNHVIREVVKGSGAIITVAGSGVAGFSGDGGPATAAMLDTPTGVAVDAAGTLTSRTRTTTASAASLAAPSPRLRAAVYRARVATGHPQSLQSSPPPEASPSTPLARSTSLTPATIAFAGSRGQPSQRWPARETRATAAMEERPPLRRSTHPLPWRWMQPAMSTSPTAITSACAW